VRKSIYVAGDAAGAVRRATIARTRVGLVVRLDGEYPAGLVVDGGGALEATIGLDDAACARADLPCCSLRARGTRLRCRAAGTGRRASCG
jgi:hypothetical protein